MRRFCAGVMAWSMTIMQLVSAQSGSGQIRGRITDTQSGDVLDFVGVLLFPDSGHVAVMRTVSDDKGEYLFRNVSPGKYRLEFGVSGYDPVEVTGVRVKADSAVFVSAEIDMGDGEAEEPEEPKKQTEVKQAQADDGLTATREKNIRKAGKATRGVLLILLQAILTD